MNRSTGPENMFKAKDGVRSLERPHPRDSRLDRNNSNGLVKRINHLTDMNSPSHGISEGASLINYGGEKCEFCGSQSLHALYLGYSFVEWICDICGARTDMSLAKQ